MGVGSPAPMGMGVSAAATTRQRPTGVAILAVLYYIGAAFLAVGGIAMMMGGAFFGAMMAEAMGMAGGAFAAIGIVIGIVLLLIAALSGATGWGMWTGRSWAWILALVLTALNALSSVASLVQGEYGSLLGLAIAGLIIWYLFRPAVKAWFGRT